MYFLVFADFVEGPSYHHSGNACLISVSGGENAMDMRVIASAQEADNGKLSAILAPMVLMSRATQGLLLKFMR